MTEYLDPTNEQPEFDPDVLPLARRLAATDFSPPNARRQSLREHLIRKANEHARPAHRRVRRSPVFALAALTAAVMMILALVLTTPPSPMSATAVTTEETIISPTAPESAASQTDSRNPATGTLYDSIWEARQAVHVPLMTLNMPPAGYALFGVEVNGQSGMGNVRQIFFTRGDWTRRVLAGAPYSDDLDFLYLIQPTTPPRFPLPAAGPASDLLPAPHRLVPQSQTFYNAVAAEGEPLVLTSDGWGWMGGRRANFAVLRRDGIVYQLWSYHLEADRLLTLLKTLIPVDSTVFSIVYHNDWSNRAQMASEDCQVSEQIPLTEPSWQVPASIGTYVVGRGFHDDHPAIDLLMPQGTDVLAARAGIVIFAGESDLGYGRIVLIAHGDYYTLYGHLGNITVNCGDRVEAGQVLGSVGMSDNTSGPRLHFEVLDNFSTPVDPTTILQF